MQTTSDQSEQVGMNQDNLKPRASHRSLSRRQKNHHCPYCPKDYTTPAWLDHHIKVKHSEQGGQEESGTLVDVGRSRRVVSQDDQRPPGSSHLEDLHYPALVEDLQNVSFLLDRFTPLLKSVVPLLEELGDASSKSRAIDRSHLKDLKRRASSPDLRDGECAKRKGTTLYSPGAFVPQESESVRSSEPGIWNNNPITAVADDQRFATNGFNYSPRVAQHLSPGPIQRSRLPPPQGMASYRTTPSSEFHHRQLQTEPSQAPNSRTPNQRESFWNIHDPTKPMTDAQPLHSLDMSYQQPPQDQSTTQTLRHSLGSSPMAFQQVLGNELDSLFHQCSFSSPPIANATSEPTPPAQLWVYLEEGDDPLFNT